jgi:hypothetical protein
MRRCIELSHMRRHGQIPGLTHLSGYSISRKVRKRVEEIFGWLKTVGLMRKTRHRGVDRVEWMFIFATAVYNLVRMRNLMAEAA